MSLATLSPFKAIRNIFTPDHNTAPSRRDLKNYFVDKETELKFTREVPEQFLGAYGGFDSKGMPTFSLFEHHGSAAEPVSAVITADSVCYRYGWSDERYAVVPFSEIAWH